MGRSNRRVTKLEVVPNDTEEQSSEALMNEAALRVCFDDKGKVIFQLTHGNETLTTEVNPLEKHRSRTVITSSSGETIDRQSNINVAQAIESVFKGSLSMMLIAISGEYTRRFENKSWWVQEAPQE